MGRRIDDIVRAEQNPSRKDVTALVQEWILGRVDTGDVVDYATGARSSDVEVPDLGDERYPVEIVLDLLSGAFEEPLFRQDGFALLTFLERWKTHPKEAKCDLDEYLGGIDYERRLELSTPEYESLPDSIDPPDM